MKEQMEKNSRNKSSKLWWVFPTGCLVAILAGTVGADYLGLNMGWGMFMGISIGLLIIIPLLVSKRRRNDEM